MSNLIQIEAPELQVIEKSKAEQIKSTFDPMVKMLSDFEEAYNNVISESQKEITKELTAKAKRLRIDIGKVRIETGKLKDAQKAEYLRAGNAIQAVHNILVWAVTDKENSLKEIENHFEILEKKRLEELQSVRAERLSEYVEDAHERDLVKFADDEFEALFLMKKKEHEDRIAAEKKAEEDRIAREKSEVEERDRIRKENEQLKKEAEKHEAELKAERERQAKIKAELDAKIESERKAKEEEEKRLQSELNKGDSEKVKDLISDLSSLKTKYQFKSNKNIKMYSDVSELIDKVINHINKA